MIINTEDLEIRIITGVVAKLEDRLAAIEKALSPTDTMALTDAENAEQDKLDEYMPVPKPVFNDHLLPIIHASYFDELLQDDVVFLSAAFARIGVPRHERKAFGMWLRGKLDVFSPVAKGAGKRYITYAYALQDIQLAWEIFNGERIMRLGITVVITALAILVLQIVYVQKCHASEVENYWHESHKSSVLFVKAKQQDVYLYVDPFAMDTGELWIKGIKKANCKTPDETRGVTTTTNTGSPLYMWFDYNDKEQTCIGSFNVFSSPDGVSQLIRHLNSNKPLEIGTATFSSAGFSEFYDKRVAELNGINK